MIGAAIPKRPRYLPRPIAETDLELAIATADPRARVILALAGMAGLRAVEIARLKRDDILDQHDPPMLMIHGKGDKPRLVPLSSALLMELHAYGLGNRGPVIRRLDGLHTHVSPSLVSTVANRHLHAMGIADTLHSLRHRTGSILYKRTKDIRLVQDVLGHSSPATAAIYTQWSQEDAPRAMEQLALPLQAPQVVLPPSA
jgi:integrase/recombinase XerC